MIEALTISKWYQYQSMLDAENRAKAQAMKKNGGNNSVNIVVNPRRNTNGK